MRFIFAWFLCFISAICAREISLGDVGSIRYVYDGELLVAIERVSSTGEVMYRHGYRYDEEGKLIAESLIGDLGEILIGQYEECEPVKDVYDVERVYDAQGNLIEKGDVRYSYDSENRLVQVVTADAVIDYEYDSFGHRVSRTMNGERERYIYVGTQEFGIIDESGAFKEFRIPGLSPHDDILRPIAIETKGVVYAPIHNAQGNIVKLIDIATKEVISLAKTDPFGRGLSKDAPTSWIFAGKNYDRDADLVYFGARYYSPELGEWITKDPSMQSENPYEYCFNDPLSYMDPDGRWTLSLVRIAWGASATISCPLWAPYAAATMTGMMIGYAGYKAYEFWQEKQQERMRQDGFESTDVIDKMDAHKEKEGKQKDGTPKTNGAQNDQASAAKKEIEKKIGRKLTKSEERKFHDHITGQGYNYHELVEEGCWLFDEG